MPSPTPSLLPESLESLLAAHHDPDAVFTALMPALCEVWHCDRCFLYLRNPHTKTGRITHCYCADPQWDDLTQTEWNPEKDVAAIDPLFATALRTVEPVYVEDVETAGPEVLNLEFEQQDYKHRALIHAPIYADGIMYAILEPCVFDHPREWTEGDRQITTLVQERLSPLVVAYLKQAGQL